MNTVASNTKSELESIQVVIDEIWDSYDVDHSGKLEQNEVRSFVLEYMNLLKKDFVFSEEEFIKIFNEIDADKSGTVEKEEMAMFIYKIIGHDTLDGNSDVNTEHSNFDTHVPLNDKFIYTKSQINSFRQKMSKVREDVV